MGMSLDASEASMSGIAHRGLERTVPYDTLCENALDSS